MRETQFGYCMSVQACTTNTMVHTTIVVSGCAAPLRSLAPHAQEVGHALPRLVSAFDGGRRQRTSTCCAWANVPGASRRKQ